MKFHMKWKTIEKFSKWINNYVDNNNNNKSKFKRIFHISFFSVFSSSHFVFCSFVCFYTVVPHYYIMMIVQLYNNNNNNNITLNHKINTHPHTHTYKNNNLSLFLSTFFSIIITVIPRFMFFKNFLALKLNRACHTIM